MNEERKLVTVLFADVVGSAALGHEHDAEVIWSELKQAFLELQQVLQTHGATVEKLMGDSVMAVFGVPIVHDDDAERAVRAAVLIQRQRRAITGRLPISFRIGINSGEVVTNLGEGGAFVTGGVLGDTVNLAARLQQAAEPGEILIGPLTYRLTERSVRCGTMRPIVARGIGTVDAFPVEGLLADLPHAEGNLAGFRAPLIGRVRAMNDLRDAYHSVTQNKRAYSITVFGGAGAGKTRLASEFISAINGATALRGRCLPYGKGITFWPLQEMLRADTATNPRDDSRVISQKIRTRLEASLEGSSESMEPVFERLAVLIGGAADGAPALQSQGLAQDLRWAVRRYFELRAGDKALTLVFEDIHWAEPTLLDLIGYLSDSTQAPIFLVCLARPELLDLRPEWGRPAPNAAAINLEPLSPEETRRMMAGLLQTDFLSESIHAVIGDQAAGNPLFIEEFVKMLLETQQIRSEDGHWRAASPAVIPPPPTVQALIAARLDRLPEEVRRLLQQAAVIGEVFSSDALTAIATPNDLEEDLNQALRRDLIVDLHSPGLIEGRSYQFKHILVHDAAYAGLAKENRLTLHDRLGRWLEQINPEAQAYADIVAFHSEQAYLLSRELHKRKTQELANRAFGHLLAVGRRAYALGDIGAALVLFRRCVNALADAEVSLSEEAEAKALLALATSMAEQAVGTRTLLDEAIRACRLAGSPEVLYELLIWRGARLGDDDLKHGAALVEEAVSLAEETGNTRLIARARVDRTRIAEFAGDLDEMARLLEDAYPYVREHGDRATLADLLGRLADCTIEVPGKLGEGLKYAEEAYANARATSSKYYASLGRTVAARVINFADPGRAAAIALEATVLARESGAPRSIARAYEALGEARYESGAYREARAAYEQGLSVPNPSEMAFIAPELEYMLALTCLKLGDLTAARHHAEAARGGAVKEDVHASVLALAALAAVSGREGNTVDAEGLFKQALEIIDATAYRERSAFIRELFAEFLLSQGRAAEARPLLEWAHDFYAEPVLGRRRARIEALLAQCVSVPTTGSGA
jgi:class 3 adenylate cyclase/tetratricopeptide (TPR) repeat protein